MPFDLSANDDSALSCLSSENSSAPTKSAPSEKLESIENVPPAVVIQKADRGGPPVIVIPKEEPPAQSDAALNAERETEKQLPAASDEWRNIKLPGIDSKQRDWTRFNRKLAYLYPKIVLPGWRDKKDPDAS